MQHDERASSPMLLLQDGCLTQQTSDVCTVDPCASAVPIDHSGSFILASRAILRVIMVEYIDEVRVVVLTKPTHGVPSQDLIVWKVHNTTQHC